MTTTTSPTNPYGSPIVPIRGQTTTPSQAQAVIDTAIAVWMQMGLSEVQIEYGIAMMNVESSYDPTITNSVTGTRSDSKSTIRGLGQFSAGTWNDTAKLFNVDFGLRSNSPAYINPNGIRR